MADELVDVCDESNNLLGIRKMKSQAHKAGLWHRAAHVWIYNSKGEILLQLRARKKEFYPNKWDCAAAGHVSAGEDPVDSARREMEEEIGIAAKKEDLDFFKIVCCQSVFRQIKNNEFYYIYLLRHDKNISRLKLQKEEVEAIRFFPIAELKEDLKTHPEKFTSDGNDYWLDAISAVRSKLNLE